MEWVQLPIVQLGSLGLLLGTIWLVFIGKLIPKATYDANLSVYTEALQRLQQENKEWKSAWETSEATKEVMTKQISELAEVGRATNALVRSLTERP